MRRLTDEQRAMAADPAAMDMAQATARWFARRWRWLRAELESAAMLGLVEAAASYQAPMAVRFITHAARRVRGACQDAVRNAYPKGYRRHARQVTFAVVPVHGSDPGDYANEFHPKVHDEPWLDEIDEIEWLTATLPARNREIVRRYFTAAGVTMATEARRVGLTETGVSMAVKASLATVRERLESRGA